MALTILEFFGLIGLDPTVPATLGDLILWMARLLVGCLLCSGALRLVGTFVRVLFDWRRY